MVPRYAVELAVTVTSEHNFYDGLVRDMGVAGVLIATYTPHQIGELIDLSIRLSREGQPITAVGEVRWTRQYVAGGTDPGIGVKFLTISPCDQGRIEEFLGTREPLLYEA
jgi:Tfp pilus assembly protein PilZ